MFAALCKNRFASNLAGMFCILLTACGEDQREVLASGSDLSSSGGDHVPQGTGGKEPVPEPRPELECFDLEGNEVEALCNLGEVSRACRCPSIALKEDETLLCLEGTLLCDECMTQGAQCQTNSDCPGTGICCGTCALEPFCLVGDVPSDCEVSRWSCRDEHDQPLLDLTVKVDVDDCYDGSEIPFTVYNRGWSVPEGNVTVRVFDSVNDEDVFICDSVVRSPEAGTGEHGTCNSQNAPIHSQSLFIVVNEMEVLKECNYSNNRDSVEISACRP